MQDHRDKTALVCQGRSLSYSELEMLSGKITRFLQQRGPQEDLRPLQPRGG